MTMPDDSPPEGSIDASLVQALLREQQPDIASLPLTEAGEGWDNRVFRLGVDLAVRLPRRAAASKLVEHEQRWLPALGPRLPLPIPIPVRAGRPGCGYPWNWSVVPWMKGKSGLTARMDLTSTAVTLGQFLQCLHHPAPADAPENPWRGRPLADRHLLVQQHLAQIGDRIDRRAAERLWDHARSVPPWSSPPLWIHGDLHPGNLLVENGRLSAVLDFGDLTAGDPATDVAILWMLFTPAERDVFLGAARNVFNRCDSDTLERARGWALALGLSYLSSPHSGEALRAQGLRTIHAVLQ